MATATKKKANQDEAFATYNRLFERTRAKWERYHKRMIRQRDFALRLKHYADKHREDEESDTKSDRIAPKGRELFQLIEHKGALIARSGMHFDVLPVDEQLDPPTAEALKGAIRWELFHPMKRYQECRDRMVTNSLAACAGMIEIAFNPDVGEFGEIVFREKDPACVAWADGFLNMHDIECPHVIDWFYMPTARLNQMKGKPGWKNVGDLTGDPVPVNKDRQSKLDDLDRDNDRSEFEGRTLVARIWERGVNDRTKKRVPGSLVPLDQGMRFMACGCGWQSPTEEQEGMEFPEEMEDGCPDCAEIRIARPDIGAEFPGDLVRVDGVEQEQDAFKWPGKKKLTYIAPHAGKIVYEGGWPFDIPTVPFIYYVAKPHPTEEAAMSETSSNWTMQTSSDMVLRLMLEQMLFTKPWMLTDRRLEDATGKPWQWGRDQGVGIYWTGLGQPPTIQAVQGAGIPNGSVQLLQSIQGVFLSNMGRTDVPLAPGESKDIAVGTVKQLIESGELPTDHAIERLRRDETPGFNVLAHLIRKTYTPARARRFQAADGHWEVLYVRGADFPAVDVIVTAEPDFSRVKAQELQSIAEFAALPPHIQNFAAKLLNVPREAVAELQAQAAALGMTPTDLPLPLQRRMGGAFNGSAPETASAGATQ